MVEVAIFGVDFEKLNGYVLKQNFDFTKVEQKCDCNGKATHLWNAIGDCLDTMPR